MPFKEKYLLNIDQNVMKTLSLLFTARHCIYTHVHVVTQSQDSEVDFSFSFNSPCSDNTLLHNVFMYKK